MRHGGAAPALAMWGQNDVKVIAIRLRHDDGVAAKLDRGGVEEIAEDLMT